MSSSKVILLSTLLISPRKIPDIEISVPVNHFDLLSFTIFIDMCLLSCSVSWIHRSTSWFVCALNELELKAFDFYMNGDQCWNRVKKTLDAVEIRRLACYSTVLQTTKDTVICHRNNIKKRCTKMLFVQSND